ncbi:50S ribosomal protein L22 [Candidatus Woesearchaeota archaeon]|nr:50S ribosomal protein L22 [Candidatus Woesearchaeota archaeon]
MSDYKYAYNGPEEGTARAVHIDAPISTKVAIEISNYLRGRSTVKAKAILERVLAYKEAIPYKRFTDGVGHKPGLIAAGRYPQKAAEVFLKLITLAETNAHNKGLAEELMISHLLGHKASAQWHFGRQRRRKMKRTHVEIVLKEMELEKTKSRSSLASSKVSEGPKKVTKKVEKKPEAPKPVEKKVEVAKPVEKKVEVKPEAPKQAVSEPKPEVKEKVEVKKEVTLPQTAVADKQVVKEVPKPVEVKKESPSQPQESKPSEEKTQ